MSKLSDFIDLRQSDIISEAEFQILLMLIKIIDRLENLGERISNLELSE